MAKILVIPDTHARDFWKEAKNLIDNYDKAIFLGDYVDPYPYEFNLSYEELTKKVINDFKEIIEFAKAYPEKVILLDGNHLLHYVDTKYRCYRFDKLIHPIIKRLYDKNHELFHHSYQIDDVLFTHAGVSKEWMDFVCKNKHIEYKNNPSHIINSCDLDYLMMCGRYRGGRDEYSGPEWLDVHEFFDLTPLPGFYQIFGHTQCVNLNQPLALENFACVDTQTIYEFDTETKKLKMLQECPKFYFNA